MASIRQFQYERAITPVLQMDHNMYYHVQKGAWTVPCVYTPEKNGSSDLNQAPFCSPTHNLSSCSRHPRQKQPPESKMDQDVFVFKVPQRERTFKFTSLMKPLQDDRHFWILTGFISCLNKHWKADIHGCHHDFLETFETIRLLQIKQQKQHVLLWTLRVKVMSLSPSF